MKIRGEPVFYIVVLAYALTCALLYDSEYLQLGKPLANFFRDVGFKWPKGGNAFATLLILAFAARIAILTIGAGNKSPTADAQITFFLVARSLIYIALGFFAIGLFGLRAGDFEIINISKYGFIALASIIFSGVIDVVYSAIFSVVIILRDRK